MSMQRMWAIALRQLYLYRGSFTRQISIFIWVAIDMVLWGFFTKYLDQSGASSLSFVPKLLGAVLLWDYLTRVMMGITTSFFEDVWSRNFLNLFASPLRVGEYVGGMVMAGIATSALSLVVMLLLAVGVFGFSVASYGIYALPFVLVLIVFGITLGVIGCALVLRFGPSAEWLIWPIPACLAPFVGVFYPQETLPQWMQVVGSALPPSYVFESLRAIVQQQPVHTNDLWLAGGLAVVYLLLACWSFGKVHAYAKQSGLLARYSAENAS